MSYKVNIRLPDSLHFKVQETASVSGQTATAVMVRALERGLEAEAGPGARYAAAALQSAQAESPALPPKPIRTLEALRAAGILKPASELEPPRALQKPFCPRCAAPLIIRKLDQSTVRCGQCGHDCLVE